MTLAECPEHWRQQVAGVGVARRDCERSRLEAPECLQPLARDVEGRKRLLGLLHQDLAGRRQLHAPSQPEQERLSHLLFQRANRLADGRLRAVEPLRSPREPARASNGVQHPQPIRVEIHNQILSQI